MKTLKNLATLVTQLAQARQEITDLGAELDGVREELGKVPLWQRSQALQAEIRAAKKHKAEKERNVREAAEALFKKSFNKSPHPAVNVMTSVIVKYDENEALSYALKHLPHVLILNTKAFESAARVSKIPFPCVTIETVPKTRIKRDLAAWLPDDE